MSMTCLPLAVRLAISSTSAPMRDRASVPLGFDTTAVPTLMTTRLQSSKRLRSGCTTAADAKVRTSFGCCTLATRLRNPWTGGAAQLLIVTISFCVRSRRRVAFPTRERSLWYTTRAPPIFPVGFFPTRHFRPFQRPL